MVKTGDSKSYKFMHTHTKGLQYNCNGMVLFIQMQGYSCMKYKSPPTMPGSAYTFGLLDSEILFVELG